MSAKMAANEIPTHGRTNQGCALDLMSQQSLNTGWLWITQPSQLCVDAIPLTYKNANQFDTAMRVIFRPH